jgi:tetratricopeptide (TPR) repeat protein
VPKENGGVEQLRLILPLNEHDPDLIDGLARKGWLISNENNSTIMPELYQMAMQNLLQPDVINCQELLDKLKKQLQLNELGNMDKTIYDAEMENAIKHAQSICNNLIYEGVNIDFQVDSLLTIILKILQSPVPDKETAIKKNYCATYAQVLFNLSIALTEKNEKNEALQLAVDSLQMSLCFFPVSNFRTGLIVKHIAYLFRKLKKNEQALELMKIAEDIYSQDPDTPEIHKIRLKISYGNIYREMKRMDQAIEYLEQCILDCKDNELYDFDRATALNCLGFVYGTMGREKLSNDNNSESGILDSYKSIDLRTAALELRNKIHKNPLNLKAALIHNNIGAVQSRLKLFDESIESYKICLAIRTDFLPKGHASIAHIKNNLATTYAKKTYFLSFDEKSANELTDAKNLCEEGFQIRIILNGEDSANLAPSYYTKGLIFLQQYRYDTNKVNDLIAARSFVQRSLVLRERWNPKLKYLIKESTDLLNEIDEEIKNHEDKQLKR